MNKILLISNDVLHYRQKVYNYLSDRFKLDGYEFVVLANKFQDANMEITFRHVQMPFSITQYKSFIIKEKPNTVIFFLHLKDKVLFPLLFYCKRHRIRTIFWNIGINALTPNSHIKNMVFHYVHNKCDALITYTPDTKRYFTEKNQKKLFVAYNTLNLREIDKSSLPSKKDIKAKYNIKNDKIILFISRLLPYKKVDILLEAFKENKDVGVVIVGPGINEEQMQLVNCHSNFYYLGEKYGKDVDEIYSIGDLFSTPGHIGLAIVEAFFWGLPVILLNGHHAPEIYYMKNGKTGYMVNDIEELKRRTLELLYNDELRNQMAKNCFCKNGYKHPPGVFMYSFFFFFLQGEVTHHFHLMTFDIPAIQHER